MLFTQYKSTLDRVVAPLARFLLRLGLSPSAVTVIGLALVGANCLYVIRTRQLLLFCVLVSLALLVDIVDGAMARQSGRVTAFGAYLDAVCDRYGEAFVVTAVAIVTGYWLLSCTTLVGALLVSYTKARAAMEVPVSNTEWPDLMERGERDVSYVVGLAASQMIPWKPLGHDLFWWTLLSLTVLIHLTVIQRVLRARRFIQTRTTSV